MVEIDGGLLLSAAVWAAVDALVLIGPGETPTRSGVGERRRRRFGGLDLKKHDIHRYIYVFININVK